eukprot:s1882_g13.t1
MASLKLEDIFSECGVAPNLASDLLAEGWALKTFTFSASDETGFEASIPLLQKSALRAAWHMARLSQVPDSSGPPAPSEPASSSDVSSWTEAFAPKMENAVVQKLKDAFLANYPSELLTPDLMPSLRLLSLVYSQLQKKQWRWIPWKYRMSIARADEVQGQRLPKIPKLEGMQLHSLLIDEPPCLEINSNTMGVNAIRNMLEVHDRAVAICQGAHLANLKAYTQKFISFLTQRTDSDSGLRNANIMEAQQGDQKIWGVISDLMSDRGWSMDDSLHELTHIRHDLPGWLQLRPRLPKAPAASSSSTPRQEQGKSKGKGSHDSIQGVRDEWGQFVSRSTACYPAALATNFAELIGPILTPGRRDIAWTDLSSFLPIKQLTDFPFSQVDGGGLTSQPDWSRPDRVTPDVFAGLRKSWLQRIISLRMDKMLVAHIQSGSPDPPFSKEQLIPFIQDLEAFLRQHDVQPDWSVREHQPMHLQFLASLHSIMQDPDVTLFPSLLEGVRTGFGPPIPASGVFPTKPQEPLPSTPLSVHLSNWQSAEQDLPLTRELVAEEVSKGFVFKYPGSLAQAQQDFPLGVSIGKLGIATSDSRPPRLVVDSSICGLNGRCVIPEKSTLPTAKELIRSFPLRGANTLLSGFSLDVKSAHKRIVLHPAERGLVGFTLDNEIYFYYVTPFGATFSASWWSRLGGWLLRTFHGLIWFSHCGMLYVDDFIFFMDAAMMPGIATLISIFCQITQIPISWKKSELGARIQWIGWLINFRAGTISIPPQKIDKLLTYLHEMLRSSKSNRKALEKLIGLLMWITQIFPLMRIWIHHLYQDLYTVPATHFSIDAGDWPKLHEHLSDQLVFLSRPSHSAIPLGSTLLAVRHQSVTWSWLRSHKAQDQRIDCLGSNQVEADGQAQGLTGKVPLTRDRFQEVVDGLPAENVQPLPIAGEEQRKPLARPQTCAVTGYELNQLNHYAFAAVGGAGNFQQTKTDSEHNVLRKEEFPTKTSSEDEVPEDKLPPDGLWKANCLTRRFHEVSTSQLAE